MALNPTLINVADRIQPLDISRAYTQAATLKELAQRGQMNDLRMQEFQQKSDDRRSLRDLLPKAMSGDAEARNQIAGIDPELFARLDDRQRQQVGARAEAIGRAAMIADTPEKWDLAIDSLSQLYPDLAEYRGKFTPEARQAAIASSSQVGEYLKMQQPQSDIGKLNRDVSRGLVTPGQRDEKISGKQDRWEPVYDAQGNAVAQRNARTGKIESDPRVTASGGIKPPSGYKFAADGSLEFIPGGPADPKTKGGQKLSGELAGKVGGLEQALEQDIPFAIKNLFKDGDLDKGDFQESVLMQRAPFSDGVGVTREVRQAVSRALGAVLRMESGAAVPETELERYMQQYMPSIVDSNQAARAKILALKTRAENAVKNARGTVSDPVSGNADVSSMSDDDLLRALNGQ